MRHVKGFTCISCRREVPYARGAYTCPGCGGNLDVTYDYDGIRKSFGRESLAASADHSIWRYAPILPIEDLSKIPPLKIGWTPLYRASRLGGDLGLDHLYLKDDGKNPSASFKDRASAVALVRALEDGADIVTGASTGNAGSSMACLSASVGLPAVIFVPEKAPIAKIAQLLIFGAKVMAVKGTYDDAFDLCLKVSAEYGWVNRNTGYNPFTREGKKTCALEIAEQLSWETPDYVVVPVGDGNIISGIWKGFRDLYALGFIDRLPKVVAAQSTKSNAVAKSFERFRQTGIEEVITVSATTIADSISVDLPRDGLAALKVLIESEGFPVEVTDEEILDAIKILARTSGIFSEPAGATSFAAVKKMTETGDLKSTDKVVSLITGNGLKDTASALKVAGSPIPVEPTLDAVKAIL
jgi:threonine synthase